MGADLTIRCVWCNPRGAELPEPGQPLQSDGICPSCVAQMERDGALAASNGEGV